MDPEAETPQVQPGSQSLRPLRIRIRHIEIDAERPIPHGTERRTDFGEIVVEHHLAIADADRGVMNHVRHGGAVDFFGVESLL